VGGDLLGNEKTEFLKDGFSFLLIAESDTLIAALAGER
jgi:hypothetical protein